MSKKNISQSLALATSTLLTSLPLVAETAISPVDVDASQLFYSEEGRVTVHKTHASATKEISEDESISVDLIFDTMTGASPNGRYVFDADLNITPVTTASGYRILDIVEQTKGAETWKTDFEETRVATSLAWKRGWTRLFRSDIGLNASKEHDYTSLGVSGTFDYDLNQRRTTVTAGLAVNYDTVAPKADIPQGKTPLWCTDISTSSIPFWLDCGAAKKTYKQGYKSTQDYLLGVTQVWNRNVVMQLNYSFAQIDGYLTDPYKTTSVVLIDSVQDRETAVVHEKRPDSRSMGRIFFRVVYATEKDALNFSYRYFWDNWDIASHTYDLRLVIGAGKRHAFEPHMRISYQTDAFFFTEYIDSNALEPDFVSSDHRVGRQESFTKGVKYTYAYSRATALSLRGEVLQQTYKGSRLPDMKAWIVQFIFKSTF